jgi:hypothetical protein
MLGAAMRAHPTAPPSRAGGRPVLPLLVVGLAVVLQLVVAVPFTVGLGLLAPPWAIVTGWAIWLLAAGVLVVTARRRPLLTPLVPLANAAVLYALVTIGESALGWTA